MLINTEDLTLDQARQALLAIMEHHEIIIFSKSSFLKLDPDNLSLGNKAGTMAIEYNAFNHPLADYKTREDPFL